MELNYLSTPRHRIGAVGVGVANVQPPPVQHRHVVLVVVAAAATSPPPPPATPRHAMTKSDGGQQRNNQPTNGGAAAAAARQREVGGSLAKTNRKLNNSVPGTKICSGDKTVLSHFDGDKNFLSQFCPGQNKILSRRLIGRACSGTTTVLADTLGFFFD